MTDEQQKSYEIALAELLESRDFYKKERDDADAALQQLDLRLVELRKLSSYADVSQQQIFEPSAFARRD